jgi:hypothetical protein
MSFQFCGHALRAPLTPGSRVILAPMRIMPETELGETAVKGHARYLGIAPADLADAVIHVASGQIAAKDTVLAMSAEGVSILS